MKSTRLIYAALLLFAVLCLTYAFIGYVLRVSAAGVIQVPAGGNIQAAIDSANCGDTIVLQAGATWDGMPVYRKQCTTNPVIVTTSGTLAQRQSVMADAPQMPRLRALGTGDANAAFKVQAGASGLILDGIDFTDNAGHKAGQRLGRH